MPALRTLAAATAVVGLWPAASAWADCATPRDREVHGEMESCKVVEASDVSAGESQRYAGLVVHAMVDGKDLEAWVPASTAHACGDLPTPFFTAKVSYACCDGDPNPPCLILPRGTTLTNFAASKTEPPAKAAPAKTK